MRVICPKCQFENQADSSRVVCARCATIIDVRPEAGTGYDSYNTNFADTSYSDTNFGDTNYSDSGFDSGRRGTMSTNYAGNYASGSYPSGSFGSGNYPTAPVQRPGEQQDVYATRIDDDDFGDVLDLPRSSPQQNYQQMGGTTPVYEDVFATPDYGGQKDPRSTADPYQGGMGDPYRGGNLNEPGYDSPSYGVPPDPEFMGWPILPEDSTDPGISNTGNFNKKGSRFRMLFIGAGVAIIAFVLWSFLSGPVTRRQTGRKPDATENTDTAATGNTTDPNRNTAPVEVPPKPDDGKLPIGVQGPASIAGRDPKPDKTQVVIPPIIGGGGGGKVLQPEKTTVTPPKPSPAPKEPAKEVSATPNRGNITIQVGSFSDQGQASERASRLQSAGVTARVVTANIPGRGTWYRVQVGKFVSREQAAGYASQIRGKGWIQDFMVTPIQ